MSTEENQTEENTEQAEAAEEQEAPAPVESTEIRVRGGVVKLAKDAAPELKQWPEFRVGDTVRVNYKIIEGDKQRVQAYEGTVISIRGEDAGKTFTVRRVTHDVGVERIFPYSSPSIAGIDVVRKGKVRRAKLFYLRNRSGKSARIKEAYDSQAAERKASKAAKRAAGRESARKVAAEKRKAKSAGKKTAAATAPAEQPATSPETGPVAADTENS